MIFKKINFKLISIILLFFCTQHIRCKRVEKRSIMQDLMSNLMQIIDPKSNQKPNMPYKIIKSEVVDGKVQKYFYTVPNVDDDKIKDLNNAIKLLSIQSMLNRHYKNQYRKHKMMKELEQLSKGNENNDKFKKLNEHTMKKYKYINNYNNHRFNKEMLKLQKQAQKLIDNSPELFKSVQDHHFLVQNPQENLETMPEFYTNSHGPEQTLRSKHKHEQSGQETPQVFLLSPNEIPAEPHKYPHESSPNHLKYITSGKPNYSPDHLKYFSLPVSKDPFTRVQLPQSSGLLPQRYNPKELTYSKPYLGPKDIPWSMKQKAPEVFLPSRQGVPWSVVPLPPPLTTLNMGASNTEYTWALGDLPPPLGENSFTRPNADMNSYWALKPLPPPMQSPISSRDMKTSASNINCKNNEDVTLETSSDPYVINTYMKNSALKTDISNENYDDPHITQESTHKTYTIDTRNNNDSKRKDKEDNQQMKQESTMQQYSINPILLQQYQRYNNQQKSMVKVANSTQNNEGAKQKDQTNNKTKKQEQVQSSTNQKESNVTSPTTFTRKYQPKNQNKQFNPEQSQNFNVNQEKILQQRQQQLKQFYEKQKQQRQLIRNNNKNIMPETKNVQDGGGRSYMFNSKLNTQTAIPIDVAIPIEESDWIPIQPKYKMSNLNGNVKYQHSFVEDEVKNPTSNVDVMLVFSNETKVKKSEDTQKLDAQESEKSYSEGKTEKHQETRRQFSNDEIQNVDETIRQLTYNKPIYDVPIINDQNPINSEKTVVIEVVNSDVLKGNEKETSVEDIEVSESNTLPVKVRFENRTKSHANKEKHSSNGEHVSPVRTYERVKVKTKRKKYENVENLNQNETLVNQTKQIENNISSTNNPLLNPVNVTEVTDNVLINNATSSIFTEKTKEKDDTLANINESQSLNNTEDITNNFNESIPIAQPNKDRELEALSLVADEIQTDDKNIQIQPTEEGRDFLMHIPEFLALSEDKFEQSEEYEPSSSNIKELIANRSKIIRPFFRSKQNLSLTTTTTSTTTTTTTTTIKPVVVKPARYIPEIVKDQKFEESKTHNNYDDYDDQLSFENIRAAQEFNFPKTDVSYSVNLPKSSQSVYKSVSNERLVDANRKHSTTNTYRGGNRHRHGPPNRQRDQSDYENREEQTYVTPTYDRDSSQYNVYENTSPFESSNPSFFNDDGPHDVDLKDISIPSPDEIDLDGINIPNPETIGVKGVSPGHFHDDDVDKEKDEHGDDEGDSDNDKDNDDGDVDEENGDDADNEESKTRKNIDTSLRQPNDQVNLDSERSNTEKHFDISSIPIPEYNEDRMNQIKEKYNIPSANLENLENQGKTNDDDHPDFTRPKDHLIKNEYDDEIPNYKIPKLESSQEQNNDNSENDESQHSYQNNFDQESASPFRPNLNVYTLDNENKQFPFSAEERFRMRNSLKKPEPDHFDEDKSFGYGKFSEEDQRESEFDGFEDGADEKRDPESPLHRFMSPSQHLATLKNVPTNHPGNVVESHIVKQIPIAFKTVIKPVNYGPGYYSPTPQKFHRTQNGIQPPFRPSPQIQNQGRFAGQQAHDHRHTAEYLGHGKFHTQSREQAGRNLQPDIVPALEYDISHHFNEPQKQNEHRFQTNIPHYPQAKFNIPQRNTQEDFSNFDSTAKIRPQLGTPLSSLESSNNPSGQNIFSDPTKVKSFANMNIHRFNSGGQPVFVPTSPNADNNVNVHHQPSFGLTGNVRPTNANFNVNVNGHIYQNQLETPTIPTKSSSSDATQGLVVYHPTKSQMKSVSHVLITPPTVERKQKYNNQPQIQEKNFQYTTTDNGSQKHIKIEIPHLVPQTSQKPTPTQQSDINRFRYLNNYNRQPTNTLQQINKQNRVPLENNRSRNINPSQNNNNNEFRNIPVRDQNRNGNFRPSIPAPRPTFTLQQIQSIKNSNLPPHIREYNEGNNRPKYDFSQIKNSHSIQKPYEQSNPQHYENSQNAPFEYKSHYSNQHSQRPHVTSYNNNENFPYRPQTFGRYNNDNNEPTESDESEEENINNNSEEGEGNDERIRPKDPIHHDTDSKEHYLKNNAQHYVEQKYQTPNDNKEFVQNIKLPQKLPKIIDKLRVTNEFTNVNVNQFNKYHPDNTELHFLPTPTPEMHLIEHKGKAKTLVFTPSQRDPLSNNLELSTPSYTLQDPNIPVHNLESSTMLPPLHFSHNLQSSTISPPHFSTTPSSIPEHPVPLLSPQQFLPPTTPLTPYYTTSIRPEEQSQFIPPEREHFLQIQTPLPTTYEQLQHQLQGHGQSQPQLISHEEPRPQFYFNQQYPFEVPQENQNLNSPPHHQQVLENFVPQQGYVHHSPRPHHIQRLPLGFPSNPDLQNFDPHNPHPNHLQLSQPQVNYPPNLEQFQLSQLADHPLLEEQQQFFPLQNMNAPGRMVHTIYPHKKFDENHSNEREGNDNFGKESQRYDMDREYSSNVNRYSDNSQERNLDLMSNEESAEHGPSQAGSKNSRTDSKIQFDYVDSKTRIQPHGVNIVGENVKVKESRQGKKQSDEEADNDESSTVSSHIYHEKTSGESYEQNTGSPVNDLVQKYVDNYNKQESKHNEQISEPDVVIQKSLQTEYRLYSQENENTQEENRFVPLNYVTPVPSNNENTNGNTNILNGHIQTFQLSDKNSGNINTNNENPFATKKPEQNSSPQQQQIPYILNGNAQSFQLPEIHDGKFVDSKKPQINFNTQAHHSPQIQHHHITQHIRGNHNNNVQENKGNTKVNKEYKTAQIVQNGPNFQHHQQLPKSQTFSNGPVNNISNLLKTNDAPVLLHNRVNTNSASLIGNTLKYSNNAQTQADNSNINPSHYLIKDSDMPTVLLNTGGAINNDKPNVKTYVQFVQPNGNIHQIVQGVVKPEQKIVKTPDIPLVLSPIHFATQTQAQNEKIKIVIPTITEQQNPVQNIHYKLPKSEVIINRFHENVKLTPKPIIVPNVQYLQGPQPFQNKNIMPQTVPFNHQQQILGYQNNFGTLNNNNQNFEFANNIQNNLNNNHNQPVITLPSHQPIPSQEFINQNIQNFQRNNQNFQRENQNFAQIQSNNHNLQSHQITQNQPIKHIPNNHQHYDIFGEYGQKTQIKEPYRFETPTFNENLKAYLSKPNQFNVYHANNRHNPQTTQVFQPIVLDFDNPNSNFYYKNKYNGIIGGNVKRPEVSDPVKLPSNLVNGVESESIIAKKVKHPSIHDLSSDQSEVSTKTINITGTGLINPHLHNKTSKPTTKRKENNSNEQLTPMMTYLTISQNTNGNQTSFEFNTRDTTSTKDSSNTFPFKNNENNIPILSLSDTKAADKIRDSKNKNTEDIGHPVKNYNINEKKHLEDKIKIELGNKQKPEESYEKMEFLNDNIGTFSSNVEVIQLLPQQISKKSINVKDKTGDIKTQNRENYFDSLNKSYDLIRQSMKIEDDKDKIDISGLYNSDANTIDNRTSKQLFHNYVNITRPNPKAQGNNTEPLKDNIPHQKQRQKVYGKTLDINYFNRRKNGLHSNEYAFDEDTTHKRVHDKNDHLNNNYSMRIINLLKNNSTDKSNELNNSLDLNVDKTNEEKNKYSTHNGHGHIFDALDILGSRNKDDIDNELLKILLSSDNISTQSKGKEDEKF